MDGEQLSQRLKSALQQLADATARLRAARAAALRGEHYNATAFDQLVSEYRQAKRAVEDASLAWRCWEWWQHSQAPVAAPPTPPTPRLLFARWLYEHGYIAG